MKFSMQLAVCAASWTLLGSSLAQADTIVNYVFDPGSYFDFSGGASQTVTGSFTYDATTKTLSNVSYDRGGDVFTIGATTGPGAQATGPTELYFGDTTSGDYDVYEFQNSLALGGTDPIVSGSHPAIYIIAGGSITGSAGAAPEPASWALMLTGFGLVGYALRGRKLGAVIGGAS